MKKKLLIILLIIILLGAYYLFGTDYMRQRREHEALSSRINDATLLLAQIPPLPQDLEQQLASAQANLIAEQSTFPTRMNSTRIINTILRLADECQVKAIPLVTQPWTQVDIGEHKYNVFRLNLAVTGDFIQLVSFISKLENGEFKTLIIDDLSVNRASEDNRGTVIDASVDLAIYIR